MVEAERTSWSLLFETQTYALLQRDRETVAVLGKSAVESLTFER